MAIKYIDPTTTAVAFNCPHCGAIAHQVWYAAYAKPLADEGVPGLPDANAVMEIQHDRNMPEPVKERMVEYFGNLARGDVFLEPSTDDVYHTPRLENVHASVCFSCKRCALWVHDHLVYPAVTAADQTANDDLSSDIKRDFKEATTILDASPRGAAALLRLCVQKLCRQLGEPGNDLNADIASLVRRGLDEHVQQALDTVRVVGNNSVHPGELDMRDNREVAAHLFGLVNEIAEVLISKPARTKALYERVVPESKRKAISKRDEPKA